MVTRQESVAILTIAQDYHAFLVDAALSRLGVPCHLISHASLPGRGDLAVGGEWDDPEIRIGEARFRTSDIRSFWNRRPATAFNMPDRTHPADVTHVTDSFRTTLSGIAVLLDGSFAVNSQAGARVAANKLNQLRAANKAGLPTPPTLVTNDLDAVRAFARRVGPLCMKPLSVYSWRDGDRITRTLTALLPDPDRLDEASVGLMPLIYQAYVEKSFEVRLTMFGATVVATRIGVPQFGESRVDWRADRGYLGRLQPIEAPAEVTRRCRAVLASLGLRFGTFDFVVDADGDWIFMEVNQAGQFAWQEQYDPATRIIEPFARFLAAATDDYLWDPRAADPDLTFESLAAEVESSARYAGLLKEPVPKSDLFFTDEREAIAQAPSPERV